MSARKKKPCIHPPAHVHPTYDPRWEICDLCHDIRPATVLAPWIIAHDEAQPAPPPPPLFTKPDP